MPVDAAIPLAPSAVPGASWTTCWVFVEVGVGAGVGAGSIEATAEEEARTDPVEAAVAEPSTRRRAPAEVHPASVRAATTTPETTIGRAPMITTPRRPPARL